MSEATPLPEFSARIVQVNENSQTIHIHFGEMSCREFVSMMSEVIARAAEQYDFPACDLVEKIVDGVAEAATYPTRRME
jgi:hypothetical protein